MATFTFKADEVRRLVDHCKAAPNHEDYWGEIVGPCLYLVGDRGVYLMSNGKPSDLLDPEKSDHGVSKRFVSYAKGIDPSIDENWYEAKKYMFGGDDGAEPIPLAFFERVLAAGGKTLKVKVTAKTITVSG